MNIELKVKEIFLELGRNETNCADMSLMCIFRDLKKKTRKEEEKLGNL